MATETRVPLTPALIEAFAGAYLSPMYDTPVPTPQFHRDAWALYCSPALMADVAAPRGHAKSTALTHDFGLATALFRDEDYIIIVSATEDLAIQHLGDIAAELRENEDIHRDFQVERLVSDAKTDIICRFKDGHECRFLAKGSGQKMRGVKWRGKRPGLIICDDLEEDEQVESLDRRRKFRRWFYRALVPSLRKGGKIRMHGTILHEDALLARVQKGKSWKSLFFRAHASYDDFSNILWPQQFSAARLLAIRTSFEEDNDAPGYSQEYLNDPFDNTEAYLRKDDFLPMSDADHEKPKRIAIGCDFAVSKADKANRTSFTVGGTDSSNLTHIIDQRVGRWDIREVIDEMFILQKRHDPETFFVEGGVIWKAIAATIYREMQLRNEWLNIFVLNPTKDKATRGRPYQKRHRAGAMRYDTEASWFEAYRAEQLRFTGHSDATLDDQFDSTATLVLGLDQSPDVEEEDFEAEEEIEMRRQDPRASAGRSRVTGY